MYEECPRLLRTMHPSSCTLFVVRYCPQCDRRSYAVLQYVLWSSPFPLSILPIYGQPHSACLSCLPDYPKPFGVANRDGVFLYAVLRNLLVRLSGLHADCPVPLQARTSGFLDLQPLWSVPSLFFLPVGCPLASGQVQPCGSQSFPPALYTPM